MLSGAKRLRVDRRDGYELAHDARSDPVSRGMNRKRVGKQTMHF